MAELKLHIDNSDTDDGELWLHVEKNGAVTIETFDNPDHAFVAMSADQARRLRDALTEALGDEVAG